jgi:hypothetical protein
MIRAACVLEVPQMWGSDSKLSIDSITTAGERSRYCDGGVLGGGGGVRSRCCDGRRAGFESWLLSTVAR